MTPDPTTCGTLTDWTLEDCCAISVQQMLYEPHVWLQWNLPNAPKPVQKEILNQLRERCLQDFGSMQ